jgi:hypothetical protein
VDSTREKKTPLIIFAYNRPTHLARALDSLSRCARLDECSVWIHCDGPKKAGDTAVEETRRVARQWAIKLGGKTIEREINQGLSRSIVGGVTELCASHGRVIVLEDDLVVRPDFVDFMLRGLDRYAEDSSVLQVSGYMYGISAPPSPDVYFLPLTSGWGWAIWKRAWDLFQWEPRGAREKLVSPGVARRFNLWDSYPYLAMLEDRLAGKNESWGILWQWIVFDRGADVLFPRRSLVWNGGFDGSGIHSGNRGVEIALPPDMHSPAFSTPPSLPEHPRRDEWALRQVAAFLRRQMGYPEPSAKERILDFCRDSLNRWKAPRVK